MAKTHDSVKMLEIPIYFHNYKLLEDKEFVLKGSNIYFVQGPNGVGKTSFLKALTSLQIANDDTPEKVTHGESEGFYEATIPAANGELLTIRHEFTDDGKGKFYAVREDGTKVNQVTEIRKLFNYTPINVSEFFAMSNSAEGRRKQRNIILKLLPEKARIDFNELDLQEQHYYDERTKVNKLVEQAEQGIKSIIIPEADLALVSKREEAEHAIEIYQEIIDVKADLPEDKATIAKSEQAITVLEVNIKRLQKEKSDLEEIIKQAKEELTKREKIANKYPNLSDEDLSNKLATGKKIVETIISTGTKQDLRKVHEESLKVNETKSNDFTKKIESCRENKASIVSSSELPVNNISFEDGFLTIDGFQFKENQICESDAVLLLANILAKINTGPVIIIGDASILDSEKLEMLNKIAESNNKVMFVDEVLRNANDMAVVGYEELSKADFRKKIAKVATKPKKNKKDEKEVGKTDSFTTTKSEPDPIKDPDQNDSKSSKNDENNEEALLF